MCVLLKITCVLLQVCDSKQVKQRDLNPAALYPWRHRSAGTQVRVKRDWIIPPIRVLENSKQVPEDLVQVHKQPSGLYRSIKDIIFIYRVLRKCLNLLTDFSGYHEQAVF